MVKSYCRSKVEIWPFRACAMHPAIIVGTVRSLWTRLWGRYHVTERISSLSQLLITVSRLLITVSLLCVEWDVKPCSTQLSCHLIPSALKLTLWYCRDFVHHVSGFSDDGMSRRDAGSGKVCCSP